jgi:diacylglycerol kinase (ATP)
MPDAGCQFMRAAAIFGPRAKWKDVEAFSRVTGIITQTGSPPAKADASLIFGGDGTLHRHLAKLIEHQTPTLIVPVGSGNDFARALGINNVGDALAAWNRFVRDGSNVRVIDVGVITPVTVTPSTEMRRHRESASSQKPETASRFFCCVGGVGFDSETNRRANALPAWLRAHGGYVVAAARTLATWQPIKVRVELPEKNVVLDEPTSFVVFANAPSYGDGMKIAPHASLEDGMLDICFVRGTSKRRIVRHFASIYSGSHLSLPEVEYFQVSRLRVAAERPMDVYADGEFVCPTPIEVTVRPKALKVIVSR